MTSKSHFDDFADSLENLQDELNQNFTLMQELDSRCQQLMKKIDKMADNYISNVNKYSVDKSNEIMENIKCQFSTAKKFSDSKVQLSLQTYELVDKHIKRLDSALARFKTGIQFKADIKNTAINFTRNLQPQYGDSKVTSGILSPSTVTDPTNPTISDTHVALETSSLNTSALVGTRVAHLVEADMPIDPNEPKFCLCNQVSYGQMIGCDNPDCPIEWFHFECVSLITKPKGKWFCPKCKTDAEKK